MKSLLLRILRKLDLLKRINFVMKASFGGTTFRVPVIRGVGFDHFFPAESWMTLVLRKLLQIRKGTFVDVGVNIGQTLLVVKGLEGTREYIGFEPNPLCVFYSNELVKENSLEGVQIFPVGIFSFDGAAKLYHDSKKEEDSCATLLEGFRDTSTQKYTLVPVISGKSASSILEKPVAILKVDVEGAELEVFEQLVNVLKNHRPFVICEILPAYSEQNEFRFNRIKKIESLMLNQKYKIVHVGDKLKPVEHVPIDGDPENANFLFVPEEIELTSIVY